MYFTISEISKITGIPVRKIRYVVDKEVGPIFDAEPEVISPGDPRVFDETNATLIICAVRLLAAGIKREAAGKFLESLMAVPYRKPVRSNLDLMRAYLEFYDGEKFEAYFADSTHFRCCWANKDSGWLRLDDNGRFVEESYEPTVVVSLDLHSISSLFRKNQ